MDKAREIKSRVSVSAVVNRYGYNVNREGFMQCPFHQGDRTASLKIYPGERGWHCFGCNRNGSVIDFVMEHDGLNFSDACKKIDSMFSLGLYRELSFSEYRKQQREETQRAEQRRREQQESERDERCRLVLSLYHRWLWNRAERTSSVEWDIEYINRILDKTEPLTFDPIARVNALISKHIERGDSYSCIRSV